MLKNGILAIDLNGGAGLEEQIGAPGKHQIRGRIACLDYIPLKQGRVAVHDCPVDLRLSVGYDKPDTRGDAATLTRQPQVNSAMADCSLTSMCASRTAFGSNSPKFILWGEGVRNGIHRPERSRCLLDGTGEDVPADMPPRTFGPGCGNKMPQRAEIAWRRDVGRQIELR